MSGFKLGEVVEFDDHKGNAQRGKVVRVGTPDRYGVDIEWTTILTVSSTELRHLPAIERLAELGK